MTTTTRSRRELVAWRNAVFVIFALSGLSMATWSARVPHIRETLDISTGAIGFLVLCMSLCSIVGLTIAPHLLARVGVRRSMILTLSLVAVGLLVIGLGVTVFTLPPLVGVGLGLFGLGNGCLDVIMNVEGATAEKELRKTVMPLMHACFSGGTVIGAGIAALMEVWGVGILPHAIGMAVFIVVAALVTVRFIPQHEPEPVTHTQPVATRGDRFRTSLAVWADPKLLAIGVIILGMAFAEGSANDWAALAVVQGHGMDAASGAAILTVFLTAMTVGRVVGGPVLDRFGRVPVLIACAALSVAGLLVFILAPSVPMLVVGAIFWGVGASLGFPVGMSAAADDERNAAARVSAVAIIGYCAFLVGPPLIGLLADHIGILHALYVVLALIALAGIASPAAREGRRRKGAAVDA